MEKTALDKEMEKEQEELKKNANIYDLLKLEHKDVKKLFKQILDENRFQDNVYMQIKKSLSAHMEGEESFLYPRLANNDETRLNTLESYEGHDVGKKVINDIDNSTDDVTRLAKLRVLNDAIDNHFEEEEGKLFKKAKKVLSSADEREIARQFLNSKMEKWGTKLPSI